ncbi:Cell division control protein Cdc25 [Mycena venus]|uniref:Cell division control protein Cdc25 n=1 Tax=Mycena venus TaxID=2733690 RepID=A0A8H6YUL8_9AGAR|nr:Cell division control protein Cdc25 [Mycena venus]
MPLTAAERERLRKFQQLKPTGRELTVSTDSPPDESIHSDEPEAPSSPLTTYATRHFLPLEELCPSLMVPRRMLRTLWHPKQLAQMMTLVTVFANSIDSVLKSIHGKQFLLRTDHIYTLLHASVGKANQALTAHVKTITHGDPRRTAEDMELAQKYVELTTKYLLMLYRTSELSYFPSEVEDDPIEFATVPNFGWEHDVAREIEDGDPRAKEDDEKSLPAVPSETAELESDDDDDEKSLPPLPNEISDDLEASPWTGDGAKPLPESPVSDATEFPSISLPPLSGPISKGSATPIVIKSRKHTFIQRILRLRAEFSKPRTRPSPAALSKRSPLAVINLNAASSTDSLTSHLRPEPREDIPYILRQSFIYDRTDPLCPDQKVDMPLPTGDSVAVRLDPNGDVKAASLPALIQLLTSHHALPVDEMCETFFLSFRLFSSAPQLLAALQARWDEQPPTTGTQLTPAQQRVWAHHMCYVRNCLAQLLLTWLDEYWRPAEDSDVLARLRAFVVERFDSAGLVAGVTTLVLQALDRAAQEEHISRAQRARDAERQGAPPDAGPFKIVLRPEDDYRMNIAVFETADGRERFAGQITALAHKHFRALDPEAVVARWLTNEPTFYAIQELEEALLMWVAMSVVELQSREERVAMIEFWLDVASICVNLRNFSSASAIFSGLVYSPVERLSLTILDVAIPSKEQYRQLNRLFDGANNYAVYRRVLAANVYPAVPLIVVLRKDVISTKEISGPMALTNDPDAEKTLINFSAYRMLKKTICTMEACLVPYNIPPVRMIQEWIDKQLAVLPREEHETITKRMNTMSEQLEDRAPPPIKKGETWLQIVKGSVALGDFMLYTLPDPGTVPAGPAKLRKNKSHIAPMLNLRIRAAK